MTFKIGMKVVCVDGRRHRSSECVGAIPPSLGHVYTIREIRTNPRTGIPGFLLVEIRNNLVSSVIDGVGEPYFSSTRFRPAVSPKQQVSFTTNAPLDSEKWDCRRKRVEVVS